MPLLATIMTGVTALVITLALYLLLLAVYFPRARALIMTSYRRRSRPSS